MPEHSYTYSDIALVPRKFSTIVSRDDVDLTTRFIDTVNLSLPIIPSPMRTICGPKMCATMSEHGLFSFMPRTHPKRLPEGVKAYEDLIESGVNTNYIGVGIEATGDFLFHFQAFREIGVTDFVIDVANGFHITVQKAVELIQDSSSFDSSVRLITGNIASVEGYQFLHKLGVDAVRVGIGSGSACSTSVRTGVGQGIISNLWEIQKYREEHGYDNTPKVIADGGMKEPGDVPKALACGADYVMGGFIFAGTNETPGEINKYKGIKYKVYAGEASYLIQEANRHIEGEDSLVPYKGGVKYVLKEYEEGLRSSMAYMDCHTIEEMRNLPDDNIVILTPSSRFERTPHLLVS